jgi:hypothetical protein
VIGYINYHPCDGSIALSRRQGEVQCADKTIAGITHRIHVCFHRATRTQVDHLFVVWDFSLVVDERSIELEVEALLFVSEVLPLCVSCVVRHIVRMWLGESVCSIH